MGIKEKKELGVSNWARSHSSTLAKESCEVLPLSQHTQVRGLLEEQKVNGDIQLTSDDKLREKNIFMTEEDKNS